jgi:hypothetical protein
MDTKTIQVFPGGQSYEYTGDPDGPKEQRQLRAGYYQPRLRCPANCRQFHIDLLSKEDRNVYMALLGKENGKANVKIAFPNVGRYIVVTGGDDWTVGVICSTCKGEGYIDNPQTNEWRDGTPEEWRSIRIQIRAEMYQRNEILCCQSSLVDDLLRLAGETRGDLGNAFEYEAIENLYTDPSDWDADRCREYLSDEGIDEPEKPTAQCENCDGTGELMKETTQTLYPCESCKGTGEVNDPDADDDDSPRGYLTELRDAVQEHSQDHPAEVYEWWLVSDWLCRQLRDAGRPVLDNDYGSWWGRTCTGQALIMDGVLQELAARYEDQYHIDLDQPAEGVQA